MYGRDELHYKADEDKHQSDDAIEDRCVGNSAVCLSLFFLEENYFGERLRKRAHGLGQLRKLVNGMARVKGYFVLLIISRVFSFSDPMSVLRNKFNPLFGPAILFDHRLEAGEVVLSLCP
jgi:hypothetical protein